MSAKKANKERRPWGLARHSPQGDGGPIDRLRAERGAQVALAAPSRGPAEQELDHLKEQLLAPVLSSIQSSESSESSALAAELRWVANEAAGLAWLTVCPLLVLPALFEEKVRRAMARWEHQQVIWRANRQQAA